MLVITNELERFRSDTDALAPSDVVSEVRRLEKYSDAR